MGLGTRTLSDTPTTHVNDHNVINPQTYDVWISKSADQNVSGTTLTNDTELFFTLTTGYWDIQGLLLTSLSGGAGGYQFSCAGGSGIGNCFAYSGGQTNAPTFIQGNVSTPDYSSGIQPWRFLITMQCTTGGTFQVQFARQYSGAGGTARMGIGSFLHAVKA